jgi:hypothetical protein
MLSVFGLLITSTLGYFLGKWFFPNYTVLIALLGFVFGFIALLFFRFDKASCGGSSSDSGGFFDFSNSSDSGNSDSGGCD